MGKQARGARTAYDALKDQLEELKAVLEQDQPQYGQQDVAALAAGEEASSAFMRLGIRAFVGRRLFAALAKRSSNASASRRRGMKRWIQRRARWPSSLCTCGEMRIS